MKFLLGTKQYMTQIFDEEGRSLSVTAVEAGPVTVLQKKTKETDGYSALQVGYGKKAEKNITAPQKGHFKGKGEGAFRTVQEIRLEEDPIEEAGTLISVSDFQEGDAVDVRGVSKGKGFQGVVKRHNFAGGRRTHGQKHSEREPGSIGATGPQRVFKGVKMGGRMGGESVTVRNLKVVKIDPETNTLYLTGAIPGRRGTLVTIQAREL